jgi:hypothetical protein
MVDHRVSWKEDRHPSLDFDLLERWLMHRANWPHKPSTEKHKLL